MGPTKATRVFFRAAARCAGGFFVLFFAAGLGLAGWTTNILLTGYWPPTNTMLAEFSADTALNPGGWKGGNWEGRGYDIYAYFPTFPGGVGANRRGVGDFEVDYQATSADFWRITDLLHPVAILGFGNGVGPWTLECNARDLANWINDYAGPLQPTPGKPDPGVPVGYVRHTTLPAQAIADAVAAEVGVDAWVNHAGYPGAFLCEYMAYHDMWYHDLHSSPSDPYENFAAGFTHVSGLTSDEAAAALHVTLRVTTDYLSSVVPEPGTLLLAGLGVCGLAGARRRRGQPQAGGERASQ